MKIKEKESNRNWKLLISISIVELILTAIGIWTIHNHTKKVYIERPPIKAETESMEGDKENVYFETTTTR